MPAAGRKGEPKNRGEMKDDTNGARDDKQVSLSWVYHTEFEFSMKTQKYVSFFHYFLKYLEYFVITPIL